MSAPGGLLLQMRVRALEPQLAAYYQPATARRGAANATKLLPLSGAGSAPALRDCESVQRVFSARAVFSHQAKVIVVLEAVAAFESKGCQRDVIHLLCPLVGLAVAGGCPAVGLLE